MFFVNGHYFFIYLNLPICNVLLHIILDSRNERKDFNFKKKIGDDFQDDKTRLSVLVPEFIHACLDCQHFKHSDHIRMY